VTLSPEQYPWRLQGAIYAMAFFFGPLQMIANTAVALFIVGLISTDLPLLIALILASRHILTVCLSIYGGALMDQFGMRRIVFLFGLVGGATALAYPLLPSLFGLTWGAATTQDISLWFIAVMVCLQMVFGYTEVTSWIGVQALVSQRFKGHPVFAGRMTFSARIGGILGPPLFGLIWDAGGPWGGFAFIAGWILCGAAVVLLVSEDPGAPPMEPEIAKTSAQRRAQVMPKASDYAQTFRTLLVPAVAMVIMVTVLRQTGSGVQGSFYIVWLDKEIGLSGTLIGALLGVSNTASALAALSTGFWVRHMGTHWILILTIGMSIVGVAVVPLLGDVYVLLMIAICVRGMGQGLNLPMMITILARNVPMNLLGRVTAMRIAFNRGGGALVPLGMGALAELVGIANSFFIIGATGIIMLAVLSVWVARSPYFQPGN
jgi:MFS family permease